MKIISLGHNADSLVDEVMNSNPTMIVENQEFNSIIPTLIKRNCYGS